MPRAPIQVPPGCSSEAVVGNCCAKGNRCCHGCEGRSGAAHELGGGPVDQAGESVPDVVVRDRHDEEEPRVLKVHGPKGAGG
eukprot:1633494-Alexandrium_andersonii.AAC.1